MLMRRFEPSDLAPVLSLVHFTIDVSYATAYSDEARDFFKRYHDSGPVLRDAREGVTLVIEEEGIIATGTLREGEVRRVFVLPARQGQGLGRMLMEGLTEEAVRSGAHELHLDSSTVSRRFYEGLGFVVVRDEHLDLEGGGRLDYHLMVRRL